VVRQQLAHAAALFDQGDTGRATRAVLGAFLLVRVGEARPDMFDATSVRALAGAIEQLSARGDEGRVLALMGIERALLPRASEPAQELDRHMQALARWMQETHTGGEMTVLGADKRTAVARSLVDARPETLTAAATAVARWIDRAIEHNLAFQETRQLPPREEAIEALVAMNTGGHAMAALFLRHGRASDAVDVIETSSAGRVSRPSFFTKLRAAAVDDTAEEWRALAREFAEAGFAPPAEDEPQLDRDLATAALWGIALEAYRRDPTSLAIAHILAGHLVEHGLPEVAPLVLQDAVGPDPTAVSLAGVLATLVDALGAEMQARSPETSRRVLAAAGGLLALADSAPYRGQLRPSAATVRRLMADIELRFGNVEAARPLIEAALAAEPTVRGYTMLGALEHRVGNLEAALRDARLAAELPQAKQAELDAADAKLLAFEVLRDQGATEAAGAALEQALTLVLGSRTRGSVAAEVVRAERLLARVLDGYGDRARAARAIDRALELAGNRRELLAPTILAAAARALVQRDLAAARAAVQLAVKTDLERDVKLSTALWLMLLERELGATPDGQVDQVLDDAVDADEWDGRLARWARGAVSDAELRAAARSFAERTEAEFYVAMRARAAGQADAAEQLARVAHNPLVDLDEVSLARDLLAPAVSVKLPDGYAVP
jgi:tetratricopeptide (TPR) repeat protein